MKNGAVSTDQSRYGEVSPEEDTALEPHTLIFEDELEGKGFTSVPNHILRNPSISAAAKAMYTLLLSYAWQEGSCFPGQKRIAQDLGLSVRHIRRYLAELNERDLIKVIRRGLGKTNVYMIRKLFQADGTSMSHQDRTSTSGQDRTPVSHKEYSIEKNSKEQYSDNSKFRRKKIPTKKEVKNRPLGITELVEDLSRHELQDPTHEKSNVSQAHNLWLTSRISEPEFIALIREARKRTLEHSGAIRKIAPGGRGTKNRAPYFFQVLKVLAQETSLVNFRRGFRAPT